MSRCARRATAALALLVAARAGASDETWPFPGGAATYVAARVGPVVPRGTFAAGVVGIAGEFAGGAWYREIVGLELEVGASWISGRHRPLPTGAPSPLSDDVLTYGVGAALKLAPFRLRAPYLIAGLGRYAFSLTERADGLPSTNALGDYLAPQLGVGYLHRIGRVSAVAELRYEPAHAEAVGGSQDLSAFELSIGVAYP